MLTTFLKSLGTLDKVEVLLRQLLIALKAGHVKVGSRARLTTLFLLVYYLLYGIELVVAVLIGRHLWYFVKVSRHKHVSTFLLLDDSIPGLLHERLLSFLLELLLILFVSKLLLFAAIEEQKHERSGYTHDVEDE